MTNLKSPLRTIRDNCLDCSGNSPKEVELCPVEKCKLWPYRFGRDPRRVKRVLTDEQRDAIRQRFARKEPKE